MQPQQDLVPSARKSLSIRGQLATCLLLSGLAVGLTLWLQGSPAFHEWYRGLSILTQLGAVAALAILGNLGSSIALRLPFVVRRIKLPSALTDLNLAGYIPFVVGLAAGVGEELLFRAALLPLVGLIGSSVLFALAHLRTSMFLGSVIKRLAYIANTFIAGICLGLIFTHIGLVAAMGTHAIIDIVGLSFVSRLQHGVPARAGD
jgi:uncharacterized protein